MNQWMISWNLKMIFYQPHPLLLNNRKHIFNYFQYKIPILQCWSWIEWFWSRKSWWSYWRLQRFWHRQPGLGAWDEGAGGVHGDQQCHLSHQHCLLCVILVGQFLEEEWKWAWLRRFWDDIWRWVICWKPLDCYDILTNIFKHTITSNLYWNICSFNCSTCVNLSF